MCDEDGAKLFGALIDILFRHAPGFCRYLLEAVRSEGESLLEESVLQLRAGRLLDQGFPEPDTAPEVYAWLDPETFVAGAERKLPFGGSETGGRAGGGPAAGASGRGAGRGPGATASMPRLPGSWPAWSTRCWWPNGSISASSTRSREATARVFVTLNLALEYSGRQ